MYTLLARHGSRFANVSLSSDDRILYAVVESTVGEPVKTPLAQVLQHGLVAQQDALADGTTEAIAHSVDALLRDRNFAANCTRWLFYAAVLAGPGFVEVCTAGSLRVHMIFGSTLQRVTRNHTLQEDPEAKLLMRAPPGYEDLVDDHSLFSSVATRALGASCLGVEQALPPEYDRWPAAFPYRVLICSDDFHAHRPPEDYLSAVERRVWNPHAEAGQEEGLVALIKAQGG